jgi:protein required for attachment to host cells
MKIAHQAVVMVVDGGKMLLFRNTGSELHPDLQVEEAIAQINPPSRDQSADRPGRASSPRVGGTSRSAMEEKDFHQQGEDRFAAEAAEMLNQQAQNGYFKHLIIVAPPKFLGAMRQHYDKAVQDRLVGEVGKTLTGHPVAEIERIILQS